MFRFAVLLILVAVEGKEQHKIVGGNDAEPGEFPHQVSLRYKNQHFCGGSILNERWVLTAAHCVADSEMTKVMTVVVGTNQLSSGGDEYPVEKVISHPRYVEFTITNDVALIKTAKPISFTDKVKPIALTNAAPTSGDTLILSGWGTTKVGGKSPDKLQRIQFKTVDWVECAMKHTINLPPHLVVPRNNVCAFSKSGEGACHGDSGGPLISEKDRSQVGVVSWGIPCATGKPDVYTSVYGFRKWIEDTQKTNNDV